MLSFIRRTRVQIPLSYFGNHRKKSVCSPKYSNLIWISNWQQSTCPKEDLLIVKVIKFVYLPFEIRICYSKKCFPTTCFFFLPFLINSNSRLINKGWSPPAQFIPSHGFNLQDRGGVGGGDKGRCISATTKRQKWWISWYDIPTIYDEGFCWFDFSEHRASRLGWSSQSLFMIEEV